MNSWIVFWICFFAYGIIVSIFGSKRYTYHYWKGKNIKNEKRINQLEDVIKKCIEHMTYVVICPQNKEFVEKIKHIVEKKKRNEK